MTPQEKAEKLGFDVGAIECHGLRVVGQCKDCKHFTGVAGQRRMASCTQDMDEWDEDEGCTRWEER